MADIKQREERIKQKRMNMPWREFVREICSWVQVVLHKNKGTISKYPPTERIGNLVYPKEFETLRDGLSGYGIEYNPDVSFFDTFQTLFKKTPKTTLLRLFENENSDYVDDAFGARNSYLSFGVGGGNGSENVLYSFVAKDTCRNVVNSVEISTNSENIYMASCIRKSYNVFYSKFITNSSNIRFSTNLIGCQFCIRCDGLSNKSYCIDNQQYSKEEFVVQHQNILNQKSHFSLWHKQLSTFGINFASENVSGSFIVNSENIKNGQVVYQVKNGRNLCLVGGSEGCENMFDIALGGSIQVKNSFASLVFGVYSEYIYCSHHIVKSSHIYYSYSLENCSYCLGCIGLKNKSFCILNKQYPKEERFEKANQIFAKMEQDGELGKFFPGQMNPFYFNDTVAYLIDDSFTKEEVEAEGYMWRDEEIKVDIPQGAEIVETSDLDQYEGFDENGNRNIKPDILKKVIKDEKGNYYRIVKMEYEFLMKHELPLPRLHWLDRIKLGFKFK